MAVETVPAVEIRRKLTPEDVFAMVDTGELDEGRHCELVDGELIDVAPASDSHGAGTVNILLPLGNFARKAGGRVYDSSTGFMVGPNFRQLRSPDVSYIGPKRAQAPKGAFIHGAPDLAVEVLSGGQRTDAYAKPKVREYLEAGAQVVWLVDLARREVRIYSAVSEDITVVRPNAVLTLDPIVPGFSLPVADIFE
ncbi:MAG: Uma2 family endonuclease [Chloroflexota bacterium]